VATALMKQTIANNGVATIPDLRDLCQEAEVKFIACQMTVELFGFEHSDFIDVWSTAARPPSSSSPERPTSACSSERVTGIRKKPGCPPAFFMSVAFRPQFFYGQKRCRRQACSARSQRDSIDL
jgi:hypothetical protein